MVLRLHVLVHASHEELDLPVGEREVRFLGGIEGQSLAELDLLQVIERARIVKTLKAKVLCTCAFMSR